MNAVDAPLGPIERFVLEMAADVTADHTADGCCTAEAPCTIVAHHQGEVAKIAAGRREFLTHQDAKPETAGHRPAAGSRAANQYGTFTVKYATEPQKRFLGGLLRYRDRSGLEGRNFEVVEKARIALEAGQVSKRLASDALDILTTLPELQGASAPAPRMATEKQVALITRLLTERELGGVEYGDPAALTAAQASKAIDFLLAAPKRAVVAKAPAAELEAGMYRVDEKIYKVQRAVHGSGNMYAKLLTLHGEGEKATFEYEPGAIRKIRPEHRMTLEQAKQFGAIYGVCCNCGATLTDERSIEAGIGPVCAGRI